MTDLFSQNSTSTTAFSLPREQGYECSWNQELGGYDIIVPGGELFYSEDFFGKKLSDRMLDYLQESDRVDWRAVDWRKVDDARLSDGLFKNISWKRDSIKLYGKSIPLPRLTSWYGDAGASYKYSGIKSEPNAWNEGLNYLRGIVERASGCNFNSVLLNWYRDGEDYLNWHADDEKELGACPTIASVNFGATRDFLLRRNSDPAQKLVFPLKHGTLLVMRGHMQECWKHSVPKRKGVRTSRFNLTFRYIHVR